METVDLTRENNREEWLLLHKSYITPSSLYGLFKNPLKFYNDKLNGIEPVFTKEQKYRMKWGKLLEEPIFDLLKEEKTLEEFGEIKRIKKLLSIKYKTFKYFGEIDGYIGDDIHNVEWIIEIKTNWTGLKPGSFRFMFERTYDAQRTMYEQILNNPKLKGTIAVGLCSGIPTIAVYDKNPNGIALLDRITIMNECIRDKTPPITDVEDNESNIEKIKDDNILKDFVKWKAIQNEIKYQKALADEIEISLKSSLPKNEKFFINEEIVFNEEIIRKGNINYNNWKKDFKKEFNIDPNFEKYKGKDRYSTKIKILKK